MAYNGQYLSLVTLGSKLTRSIFAYTTTDVHTDVDAVGYFTDGATRGMRVGDIVYVVQVDSLSAPTSVTALTMHAVSAANTTTGVASIAAASTTAATVSVKANGTAAPAVGDDTADGFSVGSLWIDVTNDLAYIAVDVSAGAAVWVPVRNTASLCVSGISANGADAAVARFVAPFNGKIVRIQSVLVGGALATADLTLTTAIAGNAVTNGVITVTQSGSAAGDVDVATPTAANTATTGQQITVTASGSSTGNRTVNVFVLFQETI
jgi:hypothetical protein